MTRSKHNDFAEENEMRSNFFMSAKTGDMVKSCLYRVAADLAGVILTKPELDVSTKVLTAEIINHEKDDPNEKRQPMLPKKQTCILQ